MAEKKVAKKRKEAAPIIPEAPVIDVTKHNMVPRHKILTKEETDEVFTKYDISSKNLPRIRADDAAVKAIGAKAGDIIEISRISITAGTSKYYRVVK